MLMLDNIKMTQIDQPRKAKEEKKGITATLSQAIGPIVKQLQGNNILQVPELALRCAQFFHSLSQYCMHYHRKSREDIQVKKNKLIKKQAKQGNQRARGRPKKKGAQGNEQNDNAVPQPPKKPLTAYIIYFQDKKPTFVERYPTLNLSQLTKLIAKEWKELSQPQKQVYLTRASTDRKRYEDQLNEFKRSYGRVFAVEALQDQADEQAQLALIINQSQEPTPNGKVSKKDKNKTQKPQKMQEQADQDKSSEQQSSEEQGAEDQNEEQEDQAQVQGQQEQQDAEQDQAESSQQVEARFVSPQLVEENAQVQEISSSHQQHDS